MQYSTVYSDELAICVNNTEVISTNRFFCIQAAVLTFYVLLHCNNFDTSSVGSILLHAGDLQHLSWLGLQWTLLAQRPALQDWLQQLFPRLTLETSKLDTNAPESICLLDLEVGGTMWAEDEAVQEKFTDSFSLSSPIFSTSPEC